MNNSKELALSLIKKLSGNKKGQLSKALDRNQFLTSTYNLEFGYLTTYREGVYVKLEGTRTSFSMYFAWNDDMDLVLKTRKPNESKLEKIGKTDTIHFSEADFLDLYDFFNEVTDTVEESVEEVVDTVEESVEVADTVEELKEDLKMSKDKLFIVKVNYLRFNEVTETWEQEEVLEYESYADSESLAIELVKDKIMEEVRENNDYATIEYSRSSKEIIVTSECSFLANIKEYYSNFEVVNYEGSEWCKVHPSMQDYLMSMACVDVDNWDTETGHCIIDFANGLSISGTMKEADGEIVIDPYPLAELYNPYLDSDSWSDEDEICYALNIRTKSTLGESWEYTDNAIGWFDTYDEAFEYATDCVCEDSTIVEMKITKFVGYDSEDFPTYIKVNEGHMSEYVNNELRWV